MKRVCARILPLMMILSCLLTLLPAAVTAADGGSLVVTDYTVSDSTSTLGGFAKGSKVNITINLKHTGKAGGDSVNLDVTKLVDSFTGGTVTSQVTSTASDPALTFQIKLEGLVYSGSGQSLRLMVGYGSGSSYDNVELTIREAIEYTEEPYDPGQDTPSAIPEPMVIITRSEIEPIKAGETVTVEITLTNLSATNLTSPVITYTPSESLMLTTGNPTIAIQTSIGAQKSHTLKVTLKATENITSAVQSLNVDLKYNYFNNVSIVQGSTSERLTLPAVTTEQQEQVTIPQPPVIISRSAQSAPISAGQTFDLTLTFENKGKTALQMPVATVTTSGELTLLNDTSTFVLEDVAPGKTGSVKLRLKAASELSSTSQTVSLDLQYYYDNGSTLVQASATEQVNLSSVVTKPQEDPGSTAAPVPNVIISDFSFGGDSVAAGAPFTLSFTFTNTGTLTVENIVATVNGGENFTMSGGTNTFHYQSLAAGGSMTQEVPMLALAAAKTGAQAIEVSFQYEYVDNNNRATNSSSIQLTIPLYQPDRFEIEAPQPPEFAYAGQEMLLMLNYVNKGKATVSNVEATVEGDVEALVKTQYLGNFEPGKSGNIGFALTSYTPGEVSFTLKVSYEDANEQIRTQEFPVTVMVQEMVYEDPGFYPDMPVEEPTEEEGGMPLWGWFAIGGGALVVLIIVIAVVRKKKKAAAARRASAWDDWDDDEKEEKQPAGVGAGDADKGE